MIRCGYIRDHMGVWRSIQNLHRLEISTDNKGLFDVVGVWFHDDEQYIYIIEIDIPNQEMAQKILDIKMMEAT